MSQPPAAPPPPGWPPPGQGWPPPGQGWPPPGQGWPPPGQFVPPPAGWPPPGQAWMPPEQALTPPPGGQPGSVVAAAPAASVVPVPEEALDFPVLYNPGPAVERWYGLRRARTGRVVSVVLSVGISAALWWFFRDDLGALFWWVAGISLGMSLAGLAWAVVRVARARSQIDRLHEGLALGIGRGGLFLHDTFVPWTDVVALGARPGRLGDSPRLVLKPASGPELELPLDYLSHRPAALDGAVRALSGGRVWVDLARLDD